jgi:glycosyltransferase involved in cell wall biosynthesis
MENKNLKFTIITPSYNEEKDIRRTLEGFVNLTYPNKEILIIDDSTDKTPEIVKEFSSQGVQLIKGPKKGCCEAVNLGIELATGDVVINADADVVLPPDFLEKLAEKYNAGADWVLVDSRAPNTNSVFSRFVGTMHVADHVGRNDMYYAEAFSCRRDLAIKLGMFGPSYPARFCRDWLLGKKLTDGGYKKVYDPSIVVLHPQPDNFKEYWATRKARGRFGPLQHYFMFKRSSPFLFCKLIAKDIIFILRFVLIIPAVRRVFKIARYSERGLLKDFFPIFYAYFIQELARVVGEWEGFKINLKYYLGQIKNKK